MKQTSPPGKLSLVVVAVVVFFFDSNDSADNNAIVAVADCTRCTETVLLKLCMNWVLFFSLPIHLQLLEPFCPHQPSSDVNNLKLYTQTIYSTW